MSRGCASSDGAKLPKTKLASGGKGDEEDSLISTPYGLADDSSSSSSSSSAAASAADSDDDDDEKSS